MAEEKENNGLELLENPDALAEQINKSEEFISKNKGVLAGVIVAIAAIIAGVIYLNGTSSEGDQEAQKELYPIQYYYSVDSLDAILEGRGEVASALDVAEDYSGTKAGNLANFYAGVAFLKKGQFDDAIKYLSDFSSDDFIVQGRAYSLIGDAYLEKEELAKAIESYKKAANYKPNAQFTPRYLMKLALAQELNGQIAESVKTYEGLLKDFPKATEASDAKKFKAKAKAQLQVAQG